METADGLKEVKAGKQYYYIRRAKNGGLYYVDQIYVQQDVFINYNRIFYNYDLCATECNKLNVPLFNPLTN